MEAQTAIYALCEPTTGEVRYVGKADHPEDRLRLHIEQRGHRTYRGAWLRRLHRQGQRPVLRVLEWVPGESWEDAERYWIRQMKAFGCHLTNATAGGDGGHIPAAQTPEARAKRSASHRGKVLSVETRAKIGAANAVALRGRIPTQLLPHPRGVDNHAACLSEADVLQIRQLHADGVNGMDIARRFGITRQNVWLVATRRAWRHVEEG